MSAVASCACGWTKDYDDAAAGKKVACPNCGATVAVFKKIPPPAPAAPSPSFEDRVLVKLNRQIELAEGIYSRLFWINLIACVVGVGAALYLTGLFMGLLRLALSSR